MPSGTTRTLFAALTGFGNAETLIPLAAVIVLWLLQSPRCAAWWVLALVCGVGSTVVMKLLFYGSPPTADMHNPSGHTSLSTLIYGALALMAAAETRGWPRILLIGGGAAFVIGIAASRLLLNAHTAADVGLGVAIGAVSLAVFGQSYVRHRTATRRPWLLLVTGGVLALALHGRRMLDADELVRQIAQYLWMHCV